MYYTNKNKKSTGLVNWVKTNNLDDACTTWYIIVNADDQNVSPTEQTADFRTYRDPSRHKNQTIDNIYSN
jgi:hypothetical protein